LAQHATGWVGSHVWDAVRVQQTWAADVVVAWQRRHNPVALPCAASLVHWPAAGVLAPKTAAQK
jgi:hypothetical protein